jgi:hypothetical protein
VIKSFDERVKANLPEYVEYTYSVHNQAAPSKVALTSKYHKKAEKILQALWNKEVYYKYA